MKLCDRTTNKSGAKVEPKRMAMASNAPKRMSGTKKSAPKKPVAKKKTAPKKPAPSKKPASQAKAAPAVTRPPAPPPGAAQVARPPNSAAARPVGAAAQSAEERRKAATRKFFARLRSLEAIVGADLRKRGSVVLMQAVDQWYNEAISATATDVSITNAAKTVIAHL